MRGPVEQGVKCAVGTNRRPETSETPTQWLWARFPSRSVHAEIQKKKRVLHQERMVCESSEEILRSANE
jgi:hypothetical protein